jgi:hypothetical protein
MSKLLDFILGQNAQQSAQRRRAEAYKSIIHREAKIGGELFGPIPKGTRREFFLLDERTWVWHEEWTDATGHHVVTTRYDVRPNGVFKSQGHNSYQALSPEEARNLYNAAKLYYQRVMPELARLQQAAA